MKVAYVTGGTKGIGLAVVKSLLENGYRVAFSGRSASSVQKAAEGLTMYTDQFLGIISDVRIYDQESSAVNKIVTEWGRLDIVVANAGLGHFAPIDEMSLDQWNDVIDVNLTGVFHTVKASVEALKKSKGYIFTVASLAGTNFFAKGGAYNASKFGLVGFTQAIMLDLRKYGIKTTTLMPGSVATHFNNNIPGPKDDWKIQPEDLGQMVVDLLALPSRTLPSKVEIRPTIPPSKK